MSYMGPERRSEPEWWSRADHDDFEARIRKAIWLVGIAVTVVAAMVIFSIEESCQRSNDVRVALVRVIDDEMRSLRAVKPSQFPAIPREDFAKLKEDRLAAYQDLRDESQPTNCLFDALPW